MGALKREGRALRAERAKRSELIVQWVGGGTARSILELRCKGRSRNAGCSLARSRGGPGIYQVGVCVNRLQRYVWAMHDTRKQNSLIKRRDMALLWIFVFDMPFYFIFVKRFCLDLTGRATLRPNCWYHCRIIHRLNYRISHLWYTNSIKFYISEVLYIPR